MLLNRYIVFNFISSPVAVFGPNGDILFTNDAYKKRIKSIENKGLSEGVDCNEGIVFTTDKGLVRCYLVSSDIDDIGNAVCIFKEITPFVSRKSMTEIIASDSDSKNYALRKIVEKNLRMSSLIDNLESGIFVEGSSGSLIQVNNSFLKIISNTIFTELPTNEYDADFYHKLLAGLVDTDDYIKVKDEIISGHKSDTYVDEVRFKDGRIYTRTFKQLYVGDEPKGYLWKFKDITIRKELESFSIELEANLQALESNESVGIYMEYRGYKFVNKGLEQLLEADRDSLMCRGLKEYLGFDLHAGACGEVFNKTIEFKQKDGTPIYLDIVSDCVSIEGSPAHVITLKDCTENVLLHKDLERNESRFRNIFEKNLAVMLIFDSTTMKITNANQSAIKFYGKNIDELQGYGMCDITIVENMSECADKLSDIVLTGTGKRISAHQKVADGSIRNVELLISPLSKNEDNLLFVIVDDVHDRVRYEKELENLNENLIQLVEKEAVKRRRQEELLMEKSRLAEMGEMIGNIAHQWRQPLSSLAFLIQDLTDASAHNEINDEYIQDVVSKGMGQIDYMSKTIDDFRDFFKPCKKETVFDDKKDIGQVLSIFLPQVKNSDIDLHVSCSCENGSSSEMNTDTLTFCEDHAILIKGYANQFKQVLLNLLANSRHAVLKSVEKRIDVKLNANDKKVFIIVEDSGGGIPEHVISNVFDPYFTTKTEEGGTGIGLYMSKAIVEDNLGGTLKVENIDGGCRFTIEVDRVKG
ncbi:MAG: hypothetical protein C0603_05565 [Denitrovibrio sp.]|nr:MAG: hypothetical protein C0603_05565 [Denitrovibrio sp.]